MTENDVKKWLNNESTKKTLLEKGIEIKKLPLHKAGNSLTFKGISKGKEIPILLKVIENKNLDTSRIETILKKLQPCFPKIFHDEEDSQQGLYYFFSEEIKTFDSHSDVKPFDIVKILQLIKFLMRKGFLYGDIHNTNFGWKGISPEEKQIYIIDFTDLMSKQPFRRRNEYAPPEADNPDFSPSSRTLSYIFAMFVVETQISKKACQGIEELARETKEIFNGRSTKKTTSKFQCVYQHLVMKTLLDSLNQTIKEEKTIITIRNWIPILSIMLMYDPNHRLPLNKVTLR